LAYSHADPYQLTKDQLVSVLPLLVQHLNSENYVIYSYAAITIERILFIKVNGQALYVAQPFELLSCTEGKADVFYQLYPGRYQTFCGEHSHGIVRYDREGRYAREDRRE
jgi:hypothetical protein